MIEESHQKCEGDLVKDGQLVSHCSLSALLFSPWFVSFRICTLYCNANPKSVFYFTLNVKGFFGTTFPEYFHFSFAWFRLHLLSLFCDIRISRPLIIMMIIFSSMFFPKLSNFLDYISILSQTFPFQSPIFVASKATCRFA